MAGAARRPAADTAPALRDVTDAIVTQTSPDLVRQPPHGGHRRVESGSAARYSGRGRLALRQSLREALGTDQLHLVRPDDLGRVGAPLEGPDLPDLLDIHARARPRA